jgi:hypothetical protein
MLRKIKSLTFLSGKQRCLALIIHQVTGFRGYYTLFQPVENLECKKLASYPIDFTSPLAGLPE